MEPGANKKSIEVSFRAPVDGNKPGTFVGSGRLSCPICGNTELKMELKVKGDEGAARVYFDCDKGLGHLMYLEFADMSSAVGKPEVLWFLAADDDPDDLREQRREIDQGA